MADNPKAAWPKTADGTTDWEYVFEDPSKGFIPLLSQVQTADALRMGATVVLEKLFTRKNDVEERTRLIAQLNSIIDTGDDVETLTRQVADLMRDVKDERIEKARVYVERKKAGASIDRRAGLFWKIDNLLKPIVLVPLGLVFVVVLSGLVYFMLHSALGPDGEVADGAAQEQQAGAAKDAAAPPSPAELAEPAPKVEAEPLPIWFKTVRWPLATKYTAERPQYYSVTLLVENWDQKIDVCRRLPTVMDRFYLSFSEVMPLNRKARKEELAELESRIVEEINALLPASHVIGATVARYGTREFRAATRAPYCKSPNRPASKE